MTQTSGSSQISTSDWDSAMMMFDIINRGDLWSLAGVVFILLFLGKFIADERQKAWGLAVAILAFLAFGSIAFQNAPPENAENLFAITLRSLVAFGLALGMSWLVLPLIAGLWRHFWQRFKAAFHAAQQWSKN